MNEYLRRVIVLVLDGRLQLSRAGPHDAFGKGSVTVPVATVLHTQKRNDAYIQAVEFAERLGIDRERRLVVHSKSRTWFSMLVLFATWRRYGV